MPEKIFVIEDDENIRDLIKIALQSYSYEVFAFEASEEALSSIQSIQPDLAIFDIMLPGMDGLAAVRQIRAMNTVGKIPIIMLTAKDTEIDKVTGLDCGADDYMTKPFGILELSARVRSLLRRVPAESVPVQKEKEVLSLSDIRMNIETRETFQGDKQVELTFKEYELLKYLMENHMRVATRDELLNNIWGFDFMGETRTLDMHVRALRQKLSDDGSLYIKTVRGVGYRFNPR